MIVCRRRNLPVVPTLMSTWATLILLSIVLGLGPIEAAITNARLIIEPALVRRSHQAIIRCLYDMDMPLFSVKFYRGLREFYRYSPHETPQNRQFPFPGINVDMSQSNESQVALKNVGFGLAGNFSCEVTADAPLFSTKTAYNQMRVVELPDKKPMVQVESDHYEPGDVLLANCSSPPSRPRTELMLTLNNQVLYEAESVYLPATSNSLMRTETSVRLHLQSSHFRNPSGHADLVLRCTARIDDIYHDYSEVTIRTSRDPVPERVTYTGGAAGTIVVRLQNLIKFTLISALFNTISRHTINVGR